MVVVAAPDVVPCVAVVVTVVMVAVGTALASAAGGVGGIGTGPKAGGESSLGFFEPDSLWGMKASWS